MYIYIYTYSSIFKQTATYYKYVNDANWASSWWFPEMNEYIIFNNLHIYICIYIYTVQSFIYIIIYIEAAVRVSLFHPQKDEFRRRIAKTHSLKTNGAPKTNSPPEEKNSEDKFPEDELRP